MAVKSVLAIDGPAGAGKSTVAKAIAVRLNYTYIDTGAMYRMVALAAIRAGIAFDDEPALTAIAEKLDVDMKYIDGVLHFYADGEDVTEDIRRADVGNAASPVSAVGGVRVCLVAKQRELAARGNVIMDGRDIGSVVLPDADLKIYLTAQSIVRAQRRYLEFQAKGVECTLEDVHKEITERDTRDMTRKNSPLVRTADAVLIDTSYMTIQQVIDKICQLAGE